ncbi:hypothetical protein CI109_100857 [Kwoniella shandongensis]|uniref:Uncharacterized protein n=1 Tax=Kwoniella shandongensis TaxID=1734106 RepID=A0A5M6BRL9_9TREE|nr:uncharacterized protein CI109_006109 [Kwoniella shandongensis]KAA5525536.1 hypothetical protein CI109_006109 [Kwoniella shandongensis]
MPFINEPTQAFEPNPTSASVTKERGVKKFLQLIKFPQPDSFILSAHRGYKWGGTAENSKAALRKAVAEGFICVEVDVRMTSDNVPVIVHDATIGRVTNIAEHLGRSDVYSPFTGKGYNPQVSQTPWYGLKENLTLKEEHGHLVDEGVLTYEAMLDFIKDEGLDLIIFMDIKDKAAIPIMYDITKRRANAAGVPAIEWVVWKLFIHYYPTPEDLEAETWWQDAVQNGKPAYIPVFEPFSARMVKDPLASCKAFAQKPYTLSLEIGCRSPNGYLGDLLSYATSPECPIKSIGFFAALGDLWPWDGKEILFDTGDFEMPWDVESQKSKLLFLYTDSPKTHDQLLVKGESPNGHDHRDNPELYKSLGFTWTIADNGVTLRKKGIVTM